jgi:hypothetical protein
MDALAIADGLATRYASLTPPTGYAAIKQSTARLPNKIATSPFVTVFLPEGEMVLSPGVVDYGLDFEVVFHYAKHTGDLARDMVGMLKWLGVLLTATYADMDLTVTGVKKAYPTAFRFIVATFGGDEWYGWEITVRVDYQEVQVMVP